MILPSLKRLRIEDFPQNMQDFVSKLAFPLNSAFDSLFAAFNNGITFADNFLCTVSSVTITVDANGVPTNNAIVILNAALAGKNVTGLVVLSAKSTNAGTLPMGGIFVDWSQNSQQLIINNVKGLPPNVSFSLSVVVFS